MRYFLEGQWFLLAGVPIPPRLRPGWSSTPSMNSGNNGYKGARLLGPAHQTVNRYLSPTPRPPHVLGFFGRGRPGSDRLAASKDRSRAAVILSIYRPMRDRRKAGLGQRLVLPRKVITCMIKDIGQRVCAQGLSTRLPEWRRQAEALTGSSSAGDRNK